MIQTLIICLSTFIVVSLLIMTQALVLTYNNTIDMFDDPCYIEPTEDCETCKEEMESDGIQYTLEYYTENGINYCEHCGCPI